MSNDPEMIAIKTAMLSLKHKGQLTDQGIRSSLEELKAGGNSHASTLLQNFEKYGQESDVQGSGIFDMLAFYAVDISTTTTKRTMHTDEWGMWDYRNACAMREGRTIGGDE